MKPIYTLLALLFLFSCTKPTCPIEVQKTIDPETATRNLKTASLSSTTITKPAHIVFCWMENKGYSQIVGSSQAPYINSLIKRGTLFTQAYGLTHPSQPNYIRWFSGNTQYVTDNTCPVGPFTTQNLYTALKSAGVSFAWYSEDMPYDGYTGCSYGYYRRRHNPTPNFSNVPKGANKAFSAAWWSDTANFKNLPQVVCITPNLLNDFHDGSISRGDTWIKTNLSKYIEWAMKNNSVFVVYYDEDNGQEDNRIPVTMVGEHIKAGITSSQKVSHYSIAKSLLVWYGAPYTWSNHFKNAVTITGFWK